jgi:hypothetical protein
VRVGVAPVVVAIVGVAVVRVPDAAAGVVNPLWGTPRYGNDDR